MTRCRMRHTLALALVSPAGLIAQVTTAQYDNARTAAYLAETSLTPRNVNAATFGRTHVIEVDGDVYAQVLYLPSVDIRGKGTHSAIFVATEHNSVYAFEAVSPSEALWHVNVSGVVPGGKPVPARDVRCPFIRPEVGITTTPVIDTTTGTLYVLARTKEGGQYVQRLHALDVTSGAPHLVLVGGKGRGVYLLDRDRMGKFDPAGNRAAVQTMQAPGMVMGASAYWNGHVFTAWSRDVIKDFALSNGRLSATPVTRGAHVFTDPGATPTISANGTRDGIVWVLETRTWNGDDRPAILHAFDAANVATELYSSESNARRDRAGTALRFTMPTVAGGRVYVGTKGEVDVYELLAARR